MCILKYPEFQLPSLISSNIIYLWLGENQNLRFVQGLCLLMKGPDSSQAVHRFYLQCHFSITCAES